MLLDRMIHACRRRPLLFMALFCAVGAARADDPDNCLLCHQYRGLSRFDNDSKQVHLFYANPEYQNALLGPHARLACTDCHQREDVSVIPHREVARVDCTRTCHLSDPGGIERRFSHAGIAELLDRSVHTRGTLNELSFTGGPLLNPGQSACLYCHDEPVFRSTPGDVPVLGHISDRAFDRCGACHREQIPIDITYYLRHIAARLQPARPTIAQAQICAVCHADQKLITDKELPNAVASWVRSFHGKAALLGDLSTASCVDCHVARKADAHLIFGKDDPMSSAHPANVASACRSTACHPGADPRLAAAGVHLDLPSSRKTLEFALAAAFIVLTLLTFGPSMLIVCMELLALAIGRERHGEHHVMTLAEKVLATPEGRRLLTRFNVNQRIQHWVLVLLFSLLAMTGFPMKFADQPWARVVIDGFGGLGYARLVHHWAGIALLAGFTFHVVYIGWSIFQRMQAARGAGRAPSMISAVTSLPMWIGPSDMLKMGQLLGYLLYLRRHPPSFGRFSVKEKFEYVGVFWGTTLLGITGALLWGEQIASHFISGRVLNIALIAHTYEAFLAIIHVGILHIINVIFTPNVFPLSLATLSQRTPIKELVENHSEQVLDAARQLGIQVEPEAAHG